MCDSPLFSRDVRVAELEDGDTLASPLPEESAWLGETSAARRRQFQRGRACARLLLAGFGIEDHPVLTGAGGAPDWPHGIVGSIAHGHGRSMAAAALQEAYAGIGLALAAIDPAASTGVERVISDEERELFASLEPASGAPAARAIDCIHRSVHKCFYPLIGRKLDRMEAWISRAANPGTFTARLRPAGGGEVSGLPALTGRLVLRHGHYCASAELAAELWPEDGPP